MEIDQALFTAMRFNFLYVDRYLFHSKWVFPESYIPYNMVRYIVDGEAVFTINGVAHTVTKNQVVYIPEGVTMECHTVGSHVEFISIRFKSTVQMNSDDILTDYYHVRTITDGGNETVYRYFTDILLNATSDNPGKLFRIRGNLELIIAWLTEQAAAEPINYGTMEAASVSQSSIMKREMESSKFQMDPRISALVDYIINHPTEHFTSESLSAMANMSESSMRRLFKKHTGKSPSQFIQDIRLTVAARRLLVTNKRVSLIAYEVGFDDPNYFSRMFRLNFGVSPQEYRKSAQ